MHHREQLFGMKDYKPTGSIDHLLSGTYYLTEVDSQFRRYYAIKDGSNTISTGALNPSLPSAMNRLNSLD